MQKKKCFEQNSSCLQKGHQVLDGGMLTLKDSWWYEQLFAKNNPYFIKLVNFK
jgi:hypothetical protein